MVTRKVGIIGYPLTHSISPIFQQAAFDKLDMDIVYKVWEVTSGELSEKICDLRKEDVIGANVTIPYKEVVVSMLDELDSVASRIGSVNTIVNRGGRLVGYNTDKFGFIQSLREYARFKAQDKNILIIGAGGAARAAIRSLVDEGASSVAIANRTIGRARRLAYEFEGEKPIPIMCLTSNEFQENVSNVHLIVNCTSMGMLNGPAENCTPLNARQIPKNVLVYDMVYTPRETPLMQEAKKAEASVVGGLHMLVNQGAKAFEIWTGCTAPIGAMLEAAEMALAPNIHSSLDRA